MRVTLNNVNRELKRRGYEEELVRGDGYFYFAEGDSYRWPESSVCVMHLTAYTVEEWVNQRNLLANKLVCVCAPLAD